MFLLALLAGQTTQQAYQTATLTTEPRNAWRWLNKLQRKLIDYKAMIYNRLLKTPAGCGTATQTQRGILVSTLQHLFALFGEHVCIHYQRQMQTAFM